MYKVLQIYYHIIVVFLIYRNISCKDNTIVGHYKLKQCGKDNIGVNSL